MAEDIAQEQFDGEMPVAYAAPVQCRTHAYVAYGYRADKMAD